MTIYTETTINKIYRLIEIQKEIDLFSQLPAPKGAGLLKPI